MKPFGKLIIIFTLLLAIFITGCAVPHLTEIKTTLTPFQPGDPAATMVEHKKPSLFLEKQLPVEWVNAIQGLESVSFVEDDQVADLSLIPLTGSNDSNSLASFTRIYAVAVPFFTVEDEMDFVTLSALWRGEDMSRPIFVTPETRDLLGSVWGVPGENVNTGENDGLLNLVSGDPLSIAIIPFEEISPQWKILKIDGISPLDKPFEQDKYSLVVSFGLFNETLDPDRASKVADELETILPVTNRDESKMTVLVTSGTTAITRGLAYKVEINETEYPVALIKDWFLSADLRHVSNESPFVEDCPPPDPYTASLVFCTNPDMIEVLENIGVNIVELTGNHIKDYLEENLRYTMQLYEEKGWYYYAAGEDAEKAREPVLIEHNGNRVAFIGCNAVGPESVWATEKRAGAAQCDFDYLTQTIRDLKDQGYIVIATFQHEELTKQDGADAVLMFAERISDDFKSVAAAGADFVQGSQAHYPMGFEFVGDSLIHYGLGNFLFDQMWDPNRNEFIDRHIIYDGKYINTELLTAILMDWSQPTPMNKEQRARFLEEIFSASR